MKIIYDHLIFNHQKAGGISRYIINLVKALNEYQNLDLKIYAPIHTNYLLESFEKKNHLFVPTNNNILKKLMLKLNNKLLAKAIDSFKPNLIHTTYFSSSPYEFNLPKVITIHDLIHEKVNKNKNFLPKKIALEKSDKIICVSNSTKNDLLKFYDIDEKKISVVYESAGFFKDEKKSYKINHKDKPFLLYVGSRHGYKNLINFLVAFSKSKTLKKDFNIYFFGGGSLKKEEKKIIKDLKLFENLFFLNGDDEVLSKLYHNCSAFIHPSLYEGFGIPILEALSFNAKIICSDIPPFREICGDIGIFFDPRSVEDIRSKIEYGLKTHIKYTDSKKLEILKKFSWKRCAQQTYEIYEQISN